jgi:hypothetical protein
MVFWLCTTRQDDPADPFSCVTLRDLGGNEFGVS